MSKEGKTENYDDEQKSHFGIVSEIVVGYKKLRVKSIDHLISFFIYLLILKYSVHLAAITIKQLKEPRKSKFVDFHQVCEKTITDRANLVM